MLCNTFISNHLDSHTNNPATIWHYRLGHIFTPIHKCISNQFPFISFDSCSKPCDTCHYAKQRNLPFSHSTSHSIAAFDLIHADIWGPFVTPSIAGHKYFLTLVDDFSRFTWTIFMKNKGETRTHLTNFIAFIETQFSKKLKCIRSDNGPEFLMTNYFLSKGILDQKSYVETPQQNGIVERKHQHILNVARALSFKSHLTSNFWHLSIQQATHIINRLPTPLLKNRSPYELLHSKPPTLLHLKVFGCLAFSSTLHNHRTKFEPHARKAIFLGYREGTKGYLLYDIHSHEFYVSRNVIFHETVFPFLNISPQTQQPSHSTTNPLDTSDLSIDPPSPPILPSVTNTPTTTAPENTQTDPTQSPPPTTNSSTNPTTQQILPAPTRKSTRLKSAPAYLSDFHCNLLSSQLAKSSSGNSPYPLSSVLSYENCQPTYKHFCLAISSTTEPKTYTQASKLDCWQVAMKFELDALESTNTWSIVDLPKGKHPIG